jgi:hypothetical protein
MFALGRNSTKFADLDEAKTQKLQIVYADQKRLITDE